MSGDTKTPGASHGLAAPEVTAASAIAAGLPFQGALQDRSALHLHYLAAATQASAEQLEELHRVLMKRAFIIAHQMDTHWKMAARKTSGLLLRLLLAKYQFGARSIEAVIEASGAVDRLVYGLPELIAPSSARIHAEW